MLNSLSKASSESIKSDLENLCRFNRTPGEGITRVVFTDEDLRAREYIKSRMSDIGLLVNEDSIGNIYGKLSGTNPELSPVWTGSHIDTVLHGGQFDGMAGVIGGLEALRLINELGIPHLRDIEVVVFTSEEPTRFGLGCIGSRALAGELSLEDAEKLVDKNGVSLAFILNELGYDLTNFGNLKRKNGEIYGFIELHIEQGAVLESLGINIGIVTTISAPTDLRVKVNGIQGHAGATPMYLRHDALTASAAIILELERIANISVNPSTVATVGKISVNPGASNVIPGEVDFTIDIRSSDLDEKNNLIQLIQNYMKELSNCRGVTISTELLCNDIPMKSDEHIVEVLEQVSKQLDLKYNLMVSGAYHDSMLIGKFAPIGMIFVPSKGGISHDRNEWTDYKDIAVGVDILTNALLKLSNEI